MKFHIGDVLSITTGRLLSPSGMEGIYKILDFMMVRELSTLKLPAAAKVMSSQLPKYDVEVPELHGQEQVNNWLGNQIASGKLPEFIEVDFWQPNGEWKKEFTEEVLKAVESFGSNIRQK